jgi:quinol monooxygenase YgiN
MSEPIAFISRNKIKEGKTDEFRKHYQDSIPPVLAGKPGTLAQLAYENEETTEFTIIRLFPSADALDLQIQGADERSKKTYEYIEPIGIEIFGTPNPATLEKMKKIAGSGVVVSISPHFIDGFIR